MKICLVDNNLKLNLNFRGNIIKAFLDKDYDVTIISPEDKTVNIKEVDERLNFIPIEV